MKCDLGNPDAPNAPPCARCRREGKDCVFSGPRASTKRRQEVDGDGARSGEGGGIGRSRSSSGGEDGEANNGSRGGGESAATSAAGGRATKRKKGNNSYPLRRWDEQPATCKRVDLSVLPGSQVQHRQLSTWSEDEPLFVRRGKGRGDGPDSARDYTYRSPPAGQGCGPSGYSRQRSGSLDDEYGHDGHGHARDEPEEEEGEEDILVTTEVHSTRDAMDLLFRAAQRVSRQSPVQDGSSEGGDGDGNLGSDSGDEGADQEAQEGTERDMEQAEERERATGDPEPGGTPFCRISGGDTRSLEERTREASYSELRKKSTSPLVYRKRKITDTYSSLTRRRVSCQALPGNTDSGPSVPFGPSSSTRLSSPIHTPLNLPPASETPWLFEVQPSLSPNPRDESLTRALTVWESFKLCQLKWVTPLEAFTYVNYFHTHLLPLSPILSGHFALPSAQLDLLTNEPLLAITILTIAARYCPFREAKGGVCLHRKLWQFTQRLVERVIWGQDRGTGRRRGKETKGLRGLGTVEALVLWTEWHPRGIHFPPIEVGEEEEELRGDMGMGMGLTECGEGLKGRKGWDVNLVVPKMESSSDRDRDIEMGDGEEKEVKRRPPITFYFTHAADCGI